MFLDFKIVMVFTTLHFGVFRNDLFYRSLKLNDLLLCHSYITLMPLFTILAEYCCVTSRRFFYDP